MKKCLLAVLLIAGLAWWIWLRPTADSGTLSDGWEKEEEVPTQVVVEEEKPLPLGDLLLKNYAGELSDPIEDVQKIGRVLENFFLLVKSIDSFYASTNRDFARLLKGENPHELVYVSADHSIYNEEGYLIDRWNTPLFFHPLSQGKVEIRSAGPDRELFTKDDIHRTPSGMILSQADVMESSLYPPVRNRK